MIHVITGAPCSGKSTYIREHAQDGDIRIDFDLMAQALGASVPHGSEGAIRDVTFRARNAAIKYCLDNHEDLEAWIIHTSPAEWQLRAYEKANAEFIHLDADLQTCLERAEQDNRPPDEADKIRAYFEEHEAAKAAFLMPEKGESMRQIKSRKAEIMEDGGIVKGYASTFDREPDSYGDVIAKGAFAKSLERWKSLNEEGRYIPLLWGHDTDNPESNIGIIRDAYEDERGLFVIGEFDAENERAQYVRKLVKEGRVYQFSFAFEVKDWGEVELEDGRKANELRELELFEVSLVQIPANQHATVEDVKSDLPVIGRAVVEIVPVLKSGRRNSAKDAAELERIGELADEIKEVVNGLTTDNEAMTDGEDEGENAKSQAEFVAAYKDAVKLMIGE